MPSELSRRLGDFRTKNKVVPVVQKVSFLFDANRASALDILSLAVIAKKSLLELASMEPSLATFEDLFDGTGKSVDYLTQEEMSILRERIARLLTFLSGYFKTLDCQQCIEYLIQRYQVHVYNGQDLILFALPYHDTPQFGSLVKLMPFFKHVELATASETRWAFLRNVHKTGSPLSRAALIKMCRSSEPVLRAITENVSESLKFGAYNQRLLSFVNVLLLEVLSEFKAIKYDISIPLFSLCRMCFKAASVCESAFFVGLSLATHIVCVAEVREDAVGILFSRALSCCPKEKLHAVLMSLVVLAERKGSVPASVQKHINADQNIIKCVSTCVEKYSVDFASLIEVLPQDSLFRQALEGQFRTSVAAQKKPEVPVAAVAEAAPAPPSSESSSDSSSDEDEMKSTRSSLVALTKKGSPSARIAAVEKFAASAGATRHCIRLSALADSLESLGLTMRSNQSDMGYLPTLLSVLPQFTQKGALLMGAIFRDNKRIPVGALSQVGEALGCPEIAALFSIHENEPVVVSSGLWQVMAVVAAGAVSQVGKSPLVSGWRQEYLPASFMEDLRADPVWVKETTSKFTQLAQPGSDATRDPSAVLGQLVCAVSFPVAEHKAAVSEVVRSSLGRLGKPEMTQLLVTVLKDAPNAVLRKLTEISGGSFDTSAIDVADQELVAALARFVLASPSVEGWNLVKALVEAGVVLPGSVLLEGLSKENKLAALLMGWKHVPAMIGALSEQGQVVSQLVDLVASRAAAWKKDQTLGQLLIAQIETLVGFGPLVVEPTKVQALLETFAGFSIAVSEFASDAFIGSLQSVCESLLRGMDFSAAWTSVVRVMAGRPELKDRCVVLLADLVESPGENTDSEEITSKELGQALLGLSQLIDQESVGVCPTWSSVDQAGPAGFAALVERSLIQFLGHCTLRKADRLFRKLMEIHRGTGDAMLLRVYAAVCAEGGSAVVLALLPSVETVLLGAMGRDAQNKNKKRKMDSALIAAALVAVRASCVEELPTPHLVDFMEALASVVADADVSDLKETCVTVANIADTDNTKLFTKLLMNQCGSGSDVDTQQRVLEVVLTLWKRLGDSMVPAITEVTLFLNELYHSHDEGVAQAAQKLVKEMDRITGENIEEKLR